MHREGPNDPAAPTEQLATQAPTEALAGVAPGVPEDTLAPGTLLGDFRIDSLLGRGGMGEVYRAEQLHPVHRLVALKLLRNRRMDVRHLAWFEVERQVLARMQHPAIAQIFDAGTLPDGTPYFAMELVDGVTVTRWCDQRRLSLAQRVDLMARVCDGVAHAHAKGVVHRDLKPGNILVTEVDGRAQPKIIDFGIARAHQRTAADGDAERAGTPAYMSPEQALEGGLADARSDVYSLGVVLCELLTDTRPPAATTTDPASPDVLTTLQPPSAVLLARGQAALADVASGRGMRRARLLRQLRHELDWVVMKAVRRDPAQRYASAAELAQELRRFLQYQPLQAVPSSRHYAAAKFVRRHRLALAAGASIALALVAGLALSLWGLMQAQEQRRIAEARQAELEQVAAFQQKMLEGVDVAAMGAGVLALQRAQLERAADEGVALAAFDQAAEHLDGVDVARGVLDQFVLARAREALGQDFAAQPQIAADLEMAIAAVYFAIGEYAQSEAAARAAATIRTRLFGAADPRTLMAQQSLGTALHRQGRLDEARELADAALALAGDGDTAMRAARWSLVQLRALLHSDQGELAEAAALQQALVAEMVAVLGPDDGKVLSVRTNLAISLVRQGRAEEARAEFEEVLRVRQETLGEQHQDTMSAMHNAAAIRGMTGDYAGALELQRRSLELHRSSLGGEHPLTISDLNNVASTLSNMGEAEDALALFTQAADAARRVHGPDHPMTLKLVQNQAAVTNRLERPAEALPLQREALAGRERTLGPDHPDTLASRDTLAHIQRDLGQFDEARATAEAVLQGRRRALGEAHPKTNETVWLLASIEDDAGRPQAARELLEPLLGRLRAASGPEDPQVLETAVRLARMRRATGDIAGADALHAELLAPLVARDPATLNGQLRNIREDAASL